MTLSHPVLLLAEDNPTNQKVALLQLRKLGHEADTAVDGREALERCSHKSYDIIFMDCLMPQMDGYEATRILRQWEQEQPPRVPRRPRIIALTANALKGDRDKCLAAGMDDYLSKPVTLNELRDVLARNLPATLGGSTAGGRPESTPLIHFDRFNSVIRQRTGQLDAEGLDIFRSALLELPKRWDLLLQRRGQDLANDAHQVRGMVAVFGFARLADHLQQLESDAPKLPPPEILNRVERIRAIYRHTLIHLSERMPDALG